MRYNFLMSTSQSSAGPHDAALSMHDFTPAAVEQEKLDHSTAEYIVALARQHPFVKDVVVDQRQVIPKLAEFWPVMPEWVNQAQAVWNHIDEVVRSFPIRETTPNFLLRISVTPSRLVPLRIPESNEAVAIAAFDGLAGILHRSVIAKSERLPELDYLSVQAGILVLCQAMSLINAIQDTIPLQETVLANNNPFLGYTGRNSDRILSGFDAFVPTHPQSLIPTERDLDAQKEKIFRETELTAKRLKKMVEESFPLGNSIEAVKETVAPSIASVSSAPPHVPTESALRSPTTNERLASIAAQVQALSQPASQQASTQHPADTIKHAVEARDVITSHSVTDIQPTALTPAKTKTTSSLERLAEQPVKMPAAATLAPTTSRTVQQVATPDAQYAKPETNATASLQHHVEASSLASQNTRGPIASTAVHNAPSLTSNIRTPEITARPVESGAIHVNPVSSQFTSHTQTGIASHPTAASTITPSIATEAQHTATTPIAKILQNIASRSAPVQTKIAEQLTTIDVAPKVSTGPTSITPQPEQRNKARLPETGRSPQPSERFVERLVEVPRVQSTPAQQVNVHIEPVHNTEHLPITAGMEQRNQAHIPETERRIQPSERFVGHPVEAPHVQSTSAKQQMDGHVNPTHYEAASTTPVMASHTANATEKRTEQMHAQPTGSKQYAETEPVHINVPAQGQTKSPHYEPSAPAHQANIEPEFIRSEIRHDVRGEVLRAGPEPVAKSAAYNMQNAPQPHSAPSTAPAPQETFHRAAPAEAPTQVARTEHIAESHKKTSDTKTLEHDRILDVQPRSPKSYEVPETTANAPAHDADRRARELDLHFHQGAQRETVSLTAHPGKGVLHEDISVASFNPGKHGFAPKPIPQSENTAKASYATPAHQQENENSVALPRVTPHVQHHAMLDALFHQTAKGETLSFMTTPMKSVADHSVEKPSAPLSVEQHKDHAPMPLSQTKPDAVYSMASDHRKDSVNLSPIGIKTSMPVKSSAKLPASHVENPGQSEAHLPHPPEDLPRARPAVPPEFDLARTLAMALIKNLKLKKIVSMEDMTIRHPNMRHGFEQMFHDDNFGKTPK